MEDTPHSAQALSIDLNIDLQWLKHSKPLMHANHFDAKPVPVNMLFNQQASCSELKQYPPPPAFRLGRVFEDVMAKAIIQSHIFELIKRNQKVMQDKITLGEMDFLVLDKSVSPHQLTQWELAIKFYLFRPKFDTDRPLERFLGPGGQDRLDKKWHRLIDHQLKMCQRHEARSQLVEEGFTLSEHPAYWLTGLLFYPLGFDPQHAYSLAPELINLINPNHQKGVWLHRQQCPLLANYCNANDRFWIIQKQHWIGGFLHFDGNETTLLSPQGLSKALFNQSHAAQVAWVEPTPQGYVEKTRLMVVSDDWPVGAPARPERATWVARP
jgi:hypothetical protein